MSKLSITDTGFSYVYSTHLVKTFTNLTETPTPYEMPMEIPTSLLEVVIFSIMPTLFFKIFKGTITQPFSKYLKTRVKVR